MRFLEKLLKNVGEVKKIVKDEEEKNHISH